MTLVPSTAPTGLLTLAIMSLLLLETLCNVSVVDRKIQGFILLMFMLHILEKVSFSPAVVAHVILGNGFSF